MHETQTDRSLVKQKVQTLSISPNVLVWIPLICFYHAERAELVAQNTCMDQVRPGLARLAVTRAGLEVR